MDWLEFILAFLAFFASHLGPTRPGIRTRLVAVFGARGFTITYSVLSLVVLVWLIGAAGRAPYLQLWPWAPWQVHGTHLALLASCLILSLSVGRPNPFSFGGGTNLFDPKKPGLVRWMRHPILIALALWSAAHLLVNGALAHVILFGLFLAFSLLGQRIIDQRNRRQMGAEWERLNKARRSDSDLLSAFGKREFALRTSAGAL
ncbi:MAG: NnrU family protein, partial [Pseudomonadota bacterium]